MKNLRRPGTPAEVFLAFLKLGCTAFGGPIAHLGFFNDEFVRRRRWLDEATFAQIVALCQSLPGPASSQVAIIIGLMRGAFLGAIFAWLGFTLPSALALTAFAYGIARFPNVAQTAWFHGLLVASVAVVGLAVSNMYRALCPDRPRKTVALATAAAVSLLPVSSLTQLAVIAGGAAFGLYYFGTRSANGTPLGRTGDRRLAIASAVAFIGLLIGLPIAHRLTTNGALHEFEAFYESGALVFGGGHVVLPLLQARVVPPGWIGSTTFLAGYGAAQAVPGPLFSFAAFVGAAMHGPVSGFAGAALALFAIYLPSFLLIAAILPFWNDVTRHAAVAAALQGVNVAVVGLLLAALYKPVWVDAISSPADAALALLAFMLLAVWNAPPWMVVLLCGLGAQLLRLR